MSQCGLHAAQQRFSRSVDHHSTSPALEQLEPELFLQPTDLLADGAVREVQDIGGGAQILQLGHDAESGQRIQRQTHNTGKYS